MIRSSTLSLMESTDFKINQLEKIMVEYQRVVNLYIDELWQEKKIGSFVKYKVNSWLSARLLQCAGKQAIQIIKSTRKKDKQKIYDKYRKTYKYFSKKNRQLIFLSKKYSELNIKYHIKPIFEQKTMELDGRFVDIQKSNNSFDFWLKLSSIGNKIKMFIPLKNHKYNKKFTYWKQVNSVRIRKQKDKYYVDLIYENIIEPINKSSKEIGIDVGINCLLSLSDNRQYGKDIKKLLIELDKKETKSKSSERKRTQIKNYIRESVNNIDFSNIKVLVLEQLKNIQIGSKGRTNKTTRKYLSRWNLGLLHQVIEQKCEENRVELHYVSPKYTSQTCHICGHIDKGNRDGEYFKCKKCGYTTNADINASINILQRFHQEKTEVGIVPDLKKVIS